MNNILLSFLLPLVPIALASNEVSLLFAGDAMQHKAQLDAARSGKNYDYTQTFEAVDSIISAADYAVVNLETPVGAPPHTGYPCFNAPPEFVDALADAGFDMMLTANNHTLDRGAKGLRSTIKELDARRIAHVGTYDNDSARNAALPLIADVKGYKIGFLNYTYGTNGISPRDGVSVDYIDRGLIKKDVDSARAAGAELVVACIHWGDEYKLLPNASQRALADYVESLGVDMLIGGHPHVIQPMELRPNRYADNRNFLLVYSLGNFISNMKTADTRGGAMLHVTLARDSVHKAYVKDAAYRLVFTVPGVSPQNNYRLLEADSVKSPQWRDKAAEFSRRARKIFDAHNVSVPEVKQTQQE